MIPKEHRLKHMKDFDILFKEGRFVGGDLVTLKVWSINPEKYPRRKYNKDELKIGFVVGLKVNKGAVKRNRLKRQMREAVALLLKEEKIKNGYMVAVIAKKEMLEKEYKEIEKEIIKTFKGARLLK